MTENGLITVTSAHDADTTVARLVSILESKGIAIFARFDHAAETTEFDRPLRPTTVVMFGNPAAGLPLIRIAQTVALDLPLRAMVWEDAKGAGTRVRAALRFDGVSKVQSFQVKRGASEAVVSLLAINFTPDGEGDPAGVIELVLAGGGTIRLTVECIDAELADQTGPWAARARPSHEDRR